MTIKIIRGPDAERVRQILRVPRENSMEEPLVVFTQAKDFRSVAAYLSKTVHTFYSYRDNSYKIEIIDPPQRESSTVSISPSGEMHARASEWDIDEGPVRTRPIVEITNYNALCQLDSIRKKMLPIVSRLTKHATL